MLNLKLRKIILKWLFPYMEEERIVNIVKKRKPVQVIQPYDLEADERKRAEEEAKEQELPHPI